MSEYPIGLKMEQEIKEIDKEIRELKKKKDYFQNIIIIKEHNKNIGNIEFQKGGMIGFTSEGFSFRRMSKAWYVTIPCNEKELMKKGTFTSALAFDTEEKAIKYSKKIVKILKVSPTKTSTEKGE